MSSPKIHALSTGFVKVQIPQMASRGTGLARMTAMLTSGEWSEWLPIHVWVIEHDEGIIIVDTGETSRVHEPGYHPSWHPFYRRASRFSVRPHEELGPQLRDLGISSRDIRQVVITHLHTDHAGGLAHVAGAKTWIAPGELRRAGGIGGRVQGYLPHRWPKWLDPQPIRFQRTTLGPFETSMPLTARGDVVVVPTPGHTPHHVSVVVLGDPAIFLAGDTSYTQEHLLAGIVDGVSPDMQVSAETLARIGAFAAERPLVYLPSHDPNSVGRLTEQSVLPGALSAAAHT